MQEEIDKIKGRYLDGPLSVFVAPRGTKMPELRDEKTDRWHFTDRWTFVGGNYCLPYYESKMALGENGLVGEPVFQLKLCDITEDGFVAALLTARNKALGGRLRSGLQKVFGRPAEQQDLFYYPGLAFLVRGFSPFGKSKGNPGQVWTSCGVATLSEAVNDVSELHICPTSSNPSIDRIQVNTEYKID